MRECAIQTSSDGYILDQLIPYIGNKRKLLPLIQGAIENTGIRTGTFCDAFSGSTVVSRLAKKLGFAVISNDWEPYAYHLGKTYVECNNPPTFKALGGLEKAIAELNSLQPVKGYIATHYCPSDDEHFDVASERMFYTQENGRRIDAIREKILEWKLSFAIDDREESVLLSALIFQGAYCSNTSGVFKGFHNGWGGRTNTALYRIRSKLTLASPKFFDNQQRNSVCRADIASLIEEMECDIAYLDPPYNQHQYGANYHLLNTLALWDKPKIGLRFEARSKNNGKSAIRQDWLIDRRSAYCYKSSATDAFRDVVGSINAKSILVSYSTDGIIPFEAMLEILSNRGRLTAVTQRYKRYRVSSQRPSEKSHNVEFVAMVDCSQPTNRSDIRKVKAQIEAEYTS